MKPPKAAILRHFVPYLAIVRHNLATLIRLFMQWVGLTIIITLSLWGVVWVIPALFDVEGLWPLLSTAAIAGALSVKLVKEL